MLLLIIKMLTKLAVDILDTQASPKLIKESLTLMADSTSVKQMEG